MKLSDRWVNYLVGQPESGMGYQEIKATLTNGEVHDAVVLNCSAILSVDGEVGRFPFTEDQIESITVKKNKYER